MKTSSCVLWTVVAVVAVALLDAVVAESELDLHVKRTDAFSNECMEQTQTPADEVKVLNTGGKPKSEEAKCYIGCMYEKFGIIKNGVFSRSAAEKLDEKLFADKPNLLKDQKKVYLRCESEVPVSDDRCVTGPKLLDCIDKYFYNI